MCEALGSQRRTWTEHGRCARKRAPRHCWEHRDIKHIKHTHAYAQTLIRNAPNSENRAHRVHQTQTLTLVPARLPKGSKQDVSGSHTYTHNDMRAADARHTYLALPLLLVALGWAADGRWWASGSPAPAPRGGDVALEAVAAALLPRLKETATRSPSDMARRLREGGGGWAKRTAA